MKQKPNAWINIGAFVAGLLSAVSGVVLWLMPSGGYRGGRGADLRPSALGLTRDIWNDLHVWGSLVLVALVLVHLAAHWCWIRKLPKILSKSRRTSASSRPADGDTCAVDAG
jgi:uncharacterized iron-regulated membrane protein